MMKILGGDCRTYGGTNTYSNGDTYKYSADTTHDEGGNTYHTGSDDLDKVKDLTLCTSD